jgi:hypothetical protein
MKAKVSEKPQKKAVALEEDARIVAGTLKGEAELRAGLGKRFKDADEFIEYLEKLWISMAYIPRSSPLTIRTSSG